MYFAKPMHKKYSTKFVWGYLVPTYHMTDFPTPFPLYTPVNMIPWMIPVLRTYLMDDLLLNQKTNNNIRISYSLKYKYSKKKKIL